MDNELARKIKKILEHLQDRFNSSNSVDEKEKLSATFGDLISLVARIDNINRYGEGYRIYDWDRNAPF